MNPGEGQPSQILVVDVDPRHRANGPCNQPARRLRPYRRQSQPFGSCPRGRRADGRLILASPVGVHQAGSSNASCFRRPGRSHGYSVMDGGQVCASKADLAPPAAKAGLGALELRLVRETSAQDRRLMGALSAVAGIAAAVSHRP